MAIHYRPTTAVIDLDALRHNAREIRKKVPAEVKIMAIVKANAYGHGAVMCARILKGSGVDSLGVATVEEGIELRNAGIRGDIFVLDGLLSSSTAEFLEFHLTPVIHSREDLARLSGELKDKEKEFPVHLKFDTGMGRLGFLPSEIDEILAVLKSYRQIKVIGVLTHLAAADEENQESTDRQFLLFEKLKNLLVEKGLNAPMYHIANSAAIIDGKLGGKGFNQPQSGGEGEAQRALPAEGATPAPLIVRPGIMLYGCYPNPRHREKMALKPVMTLKTKIMSVSKHPAGTPLSYGGTFVTKKESLIAALPIGYADGYPRLLSNRSQVLIAGKRAPVVGRICMDLTLIDVTDIPEVKAGDEAVLIGKQGTEEILAEEVAALAETISYEILCGISQRVPRVYLGM